MRCFVYDRERKHLVGSLLDYLSQSLVGRHSILGVFALGRFFSAGAAAAASAKRVAVHKQT